MSETFTLIRTNVNVMIFSLFLPQILVMNLKKALIAVQKHIENYSTLGKGNLSGLQNTINEMRHERRK